MTETGPGPWRVLLTILLSTGCSASFGAGAVRRSGADSVWIRQAGFESFSKGELGDAGRNIYVSARGNIEMIHRWDLDRDGFPDLLFTQDTNARTETPDALIYWGSKDGFASLFPPMWEERARSSLLENILKNQDRLSFLPTFGGGRCRIADLNRDGYLDIVFVNLIHNYTHLLSAYIYWGGPEPYGPQRRSEVPTLFAHGLDVGDLDGDGYPDLVLANRGDYEREARWGPHDDRESYIYWGGPAGFSPDHRTSVATHNALDCAIGDFDGDGFADLAFLNAPRGEDASLTVYYGSRGRFSSAKRVDLAIAGGTALRTARLRRGRFADLVVTTARDASLVFYGGKAGLGLANPVRLATSSAADVAAADLDGDGAVDLVVANSAGPESVIHWGSADGLSPERQTRLPTLAARGVAVADFDGNGLPDIVFANSEAPEAYTVALGQRPTATHDVPSYIYWGSKTGFTPYRRSEIQGFGAVSVAAGDLNRDGVQDILLMNQLSGPLPNRLNALIFRGNAEHHYSSASMLRLYDVPDGQVSNADLNDDGYPDLVFQSTICWGGASGYSDGNRTVLGAGGTLCGSRVADLNHDGYLDLLYSEAHENQRYSARIFWGGPDGYSNSRTESFPLPGFVLYPTLADLNRDGYLDLINPDLNGRSSIIWGGPGGFAAQEPLFLKTDSSNMAQVADLNSDGWPDLIFCGSGNSEKRSWKSDSHIYFGGPRGFLGREPVKLEGYVSLEAGVADLNRDGYLDLVFGNYSAGLVRSLPVFVYWGGVDGTFHNSRRTDLPAESSAGIQVLDLDGNGYPDIVVHNHIKDGKHDFGSYIYWGGQEGFSVSRRTRLPTTGTHMSYMMDPGNVGTRKLEETYLSAPLPAPAGTRFARLHWKAECSFGTAVRFQIRAASGPAELRGARWEGPRGPGSYFTASGVALPESARAQPWIQYRSVLSSPDGGNTAVLQEVNLECERGHP